MNERIRELASKCYKTGPLGRGGWPEYTTFDHETFAELLVRECIICMYRRGVEGFSILEEQMLKRHFGVE